VGGCRGWRGRGAKKTVFCRREKALGGISKPGDQKPGARFLCPIGRERLLLNGVGGGKQNLKSGALMSNLVAGGCGGEKRRGAAGGASKRESTLKREPGKGDAGGVGGEGGGGGWQDGPPGKECLGGGGVFFRSEKGVESGVMSTRRSHESGKIKGTGRRLPDFLDCTREGGGSYGAGKRGERDARLVGGEGVPRSARAAERWPPKREKKNKA